MHDNKKKGKGEEGLSGRANAKSGKQDGVSSLSFISIQRLVHF